MDRKYEQLTIMDVFILGKVLENMKLGRRLMEKLTGRKIRYIVYPKNNIISRRDGTQGIYMEIHIHEEARKVQNVRLFLCGEDKFRFGCPIYRFEDRCKELPQLKLDGGLLQIFVAYTDKLEEQVQDEDVRAFLYYMKNPKDKRTNFVKMLDDEVRRIKMNKLFKKEYEAMQREETEMQQRAYAQARKKGKK